MIRRAQFAGQFYPQARPELSQMIDSFLNSADVKNRDNNLKALIVPHAGYVFSGIVSAAGYKLLGSIGRQIKSIILLGPSHQLAVNTPAGALFEKWETPLGRVEADLRTLNQLKTIEIFNQAHLMEHSLEVQIPFLQKVLRSFKIIPLLINRPAPQEFIQELQRLVEKGAFLVVSSDLSHYYSYSEALVLDRRASSAIVNLDLREIEDRVEACGKEAILSLIRLAQELNWKGFLLDYKNSGDTFGDKAQVVGYGSYGFFS